MVLFNRLRPNPAGLATTVENFGQMPADATVVPSLNPISVAPAAITPRAIPVATFLSQLPAQLRLGVPLLLMNASLELEPGEPLVRATAREVTWPDVNADDYGTICELQARGIVLIPTQNINERAHQALREPKLHPIFLPGVAGSKNIRSIPTRRDSEIYRVINVEDLEDYQLVSTAAARNVGYGFIYTQDQIPLENVTPSLTPQDLFPDRPLDRLRHYRAQTQILRVYNGTVIIVEMKGEMAKIPVACDTAVDPGLLGIFADGFKQRIETILENLYQLATIQ